MKPQNKGGQIALAIWFLIAVSCVSGSSHFQELVKHSTATEESLQRQLGARPEVGFHTVNGELDIVVARFDSAAVSKQSLSELLLIVRGTVREHFQVEPREIQVVLTLTAEST